MWRKGSPSPRHPAPPLRSALRWWSQGLAGAGTVKSSSSGPLDQFYSEAHRQPWVTRTKAPGFTASSLALWVVTRKTPSMVWGIRLLTMVNQILNNWSLAKTHKREWKNNILKSAGYINYDWFIGKIPIVTRSYRKSFQKMFRMRDRLVLDSMYSERKGEEAKWREIIRDIYRVRAGRLGRSGPEMVICLWVLVASAKKVAHAT